MVNELSTFQRKAFYISIITHPLLMPVWGFIVFNNYNSTSFRGHSYFVLLAVYTLTVVILPAYFVYALKRSGYINSYEMETLNERKLPLLFISGTMLFNYYLMNRSHLPELFLLYFLSTSVAAVLTLAISNFYKISMHTIGIGFMFGLGLVLSYLSVADMRGYLIITALSSGLIACSRMILMAHSLAEIYWGFVIGFICSTGMLYFI